MTRGLCCCPKCSVQAFTHESGAKLVQTLACVACCAIICTRLGRIVSHFSAGESVMVNCKVAAVYLAGGAVYSKVYLAGEAGEVPSLETEAWTQIVNTSHPTNTSHSPNTHVNAVHSRQ